VFGNIFSNPVTKEITRAVPEGLAAPHLLKPLFFLHVQLLMVEI
jgi:hypothetical protein